MLNNKSLISLLSGSAILSGSYFYGDLKQVLFEESDSREGFYEA